ncbi:MAG: DUF364 domain-containing protein [Pelosinus sp.]|nr:DUF364 domain-containing protein [Pelosinus sp.]
MYDALIEGIPEGCMVDEIICGSCNSFVRSGNGAGIAAFRPYTSRKPLFTKDLMGAPLREVARCIKSWNLVEASMGAAAINAYYNNPQVARQSGVEFSDAKRVEDRNYDPFIMSQNEIKSKKVAVVGHFPYLEKFFAPVCDLSIIEWEPEEGDYPIMAAEYLLPESDYVFLTCTSLVDKTLPRLLELSKEAQKVTVVGPGTTLAPLLFDFGIGDLSGFIIKDNLRAARIVGGIEKVRIYTTGQKVHLTKGV